MKRFLLFGLLVFLGNQMYSQKFTLNGNVSDNLGQVLPGASVVLVGTFSGASTNNLGTYELKNIKAGNYFVEVSFLGFETQKQEINLDKNTELNFKLLPKTLISDEVIVQATRAKISTPVAQSLINKSDIDRVNIVADVPYLLEQSPSLVATSENGTGNGYTGMRIRGTDITRINVTMNGIPYNDAESQGVYWVDVPDFSSSVNSIQIQRGVGTSTNGSAAFGASVNFQTLALEPESYARISSSIGSFNTFKENISLGTGLLKNKFAFDVRASKLNSDGYIQRGFSDHQSLYFSAGYYGETDLLKAIVMIGKEKTGITWWGVPSLMVNSIRNFNPSGKHFDDNGNEQFYGETDNYWQNNYQLLYSKEINKNLNLNASAFATTGKGYYEEYIPNVDDLGNDNLYANYGLNNIYLNDSILSYGSNEYIFSDSTIKSSDMIRQKWLDNVFYGLNANVNYHKNKIDVVFGISENNYDGDHFGKIKWIKFNANIPQDYQWYNNKGKKTDLSSFLKIQYMLSEKISIFGDLQIRNILYKMNGPDDDLISLNQEHNWLFANPKAGINYQINQQQRFYASFSVANREPARADLKEALKEGGTKTPTYETLNDIEFGYQIQNTKYFIGANAFYMLYNNQLVNTGELNDVGYSIMTNVKNSFRRGIEFVFGYKLMKNLDWNANLTLSQNKIQNYVETSAYYDIAWDTTYKTKELGETDISYSPNIIGASALRFEVLKNIGLNLTSKYVGEQYFDNTSSKERMINAYFVNNFGIDYIFNFKNKNNIKFQLVVNNIFNEKYSSNAYGGNYYDLNVEKTWAYYYTQAGTNFMFKIALEL